LSGKQTFQPLFSAAPIWHKRFQQLDGLHSIRINKRWRLVFRWDGGRGEAEDLYLDDHSYD
jgi:plasmid maintenance system killer protein